MPLAQTLAQLLEGFAMLEMKLKEGQEMGSSLRSHPLLGDLRQRMDKFVKTRGRQEIQVSPRAPELRKAGPLCPHWLLGQGCGCRLLLPSLL